MHSHERRKQGEIRTMVQTFNSDYEIAAWLNLAIVAPTVHVHNFAHEIPGSPNVRICTCGARRTRYVDCFGNVAYTTQQITVR